jgi:hypothetical protein
VSCRFPWAHQHAQKIVVAKAKRAAIDADDARGAATNHFESRATAETQFFKTANLIARPNKLADFGDLTASEVGEGHETTHDGGSEVLRGS